MLMTCCCMCLASRKRCSMALGSCSSCRSFLSAPTSSSPQLASLLQIVHPGAVHTHTVKTFCPPPPVQPQLASLLQIVHPGAVHTHTVKTFCPPPPVQPQLASLLQIVHPGAVHIQLKLSVHPHQFNHSWPHCYR